VSTSCVSKANNAGEGDEKVSSVVNRGQGGNHLIFSGMKMIITCYCTYQQIKVFVKNSRLSPMVAGLTEGECEEVFRREIKKQNNCFDFPGRNIFSWGNVGHI